eukprot:jgi/Ulvmu1/2813/UM142_0011.1
MSLSVHDLHLRAKNFEATAKQRFEVDKRKAEKERIIKERAQARREAHEAAVVELRRRQEEEAERAELQRQADVEHNRGVCISATLTAVPMSTEIAEAKGIKRNADKIILPARLSNEFMKQNAHELGVSFWRLSARDGRSTAASVLEFSAPDGVVMLPPKVVHSLWGLDAQAHGDILVEFRRLEPGKFVSFTPQSSDFQTIVSAASLDLAAILQDTLMRHTTLSEGDWISVPLPVVQPPAELNTDTAEAGASQQWLQVCKLEPDAHVSLVDTDMEADVTPSQEFMERMAEEQEAARREAERVAKLEADEARRQADAAAAAAADAEEKSRVAAARHQLALTLPPEPAEDCADALINARFQMPGGDRVQRRFRLDAPVSEMFNFVESVGAGGLMPGSYRLVTRYPRRVIDCTATGTLRDCGIGAGQEVFVLESSM